MCELGFSKEAIRHRLRTGRLHRKARGVYAVGSPNLTAYGRLMVAIKACGPATVLSHLSAAVLWNIWKWGPPEIHVTVPAARNPRPAGVIVHRRDLKPRATTRHHGVPVTSVLQTLVDCAPGLPEPKVERMINQADALNLLRADALRKQLDRRLEPGAAILRNILDRHSFVLTDSELERLFVPIAVRAGLPKPLTQHVLCGYRWDFYFPELKRVVEVDGLRYHRTPLQQRRDLERQHALAKVQIECTRFTYWQIAKEAKTVEATCATFKPPARTTDRPRAA